MSIVFLPIVPDKFYNEKKFVCIAYKIIDFWAFLERLNQQSYFYILL